MDPVIDYGLHPCMHARTWWCAHSKTEYHGRLDLQAGDGVLLVVVGQTRCLGDNPLKDVVDKRVHDGHGLAGDARIRVDLLHQLVDVDGVALLAKASSFCSSLREALVWLPSFPSC